MTIHIGTSGWSYDHWQGLLYPEKTPVGKRLPYYLARYDTVEVNNTYYRWPADAVFAGWKAKLPPGFVMSVKAARGLSHYARLNNPQEWMQRMAQGMWGLGEHLGVFLVQLPPQFACHYERLETFLKTVPYWAESDAGIPASKLARGRNLRAFGAVWSRVLRDERSQSALRPARNRFVCLCALSRPRHQLAVRRVIFG